MYSVRGTKKKPKGLSKLCNPFLYDHKDQYNKNTHKIIINKNKNKIEEDKSVL